MSSRRKNQAVNLQPWYGEAQLLITLAGQTMSQEEYEDIQEYVRGKLERKYGTALVNVEILAGDGEWGDPNDLL